jgi:hypothetical protein
MRDVVKGDDAAGEDGAGKCECKTEQAKDLRWRNVPCI